MITTRRLSYQDGTTIFEGVVAFDNESDDIRPVVMVCHTYKGQSEFEEKKAIEIAKLGYIGFAIDVYGKGIRAGSPDEALSLMNGLNANRPLLLSRMLASLQAVQMIPNADLTRIGAIGFCFGGKCVLDLVRSGEKLSGVASFHGVFDAPKINQKTNINTPIILFHGWDDPLAKPNDVVALTEELTRKLAVWELVAYGHTGHAFTNHAAQSPKQGMAYSEYADHESWERMKKFFASVFK